MALRGHLSVEFGHLHEPAAARFVWCLVTGPSSSFTGRTHLMSFQNLDFLRFLGLWQSWGCVDEGSFSSPTPLFCGGWLFMVFFFCVYLRRSLYSILSLGKNCASSSAWSLVVEKDKETNTTVVIYRTCALLKITQHWTLRTLKICTEVKICLYKQHSHCI